MSADIRSMPQTDAAPAASATDAPLHLENISRHFREGEARLDVLKSASLTINSGEMVALIAPSGAGKSTLLHIAGLLERPDEGEVYMAGRPCGRLPDAERTRIRRMDVGFVYQFHHLLPEFSALDNLVLPQMIRGLDRATAGERGRELLAYLKLQDRADHLPSQLSGGEQQRVAIARAVVNAPRILFADEPTGNLDPNTADHVFDALAALVRASQLAALIATHNLELAARMDRRVTLRDGAVMELE